MGRHASPLRVRISRPELVGELADALADGDCLCAHVDDETVLVVHRTATDDAEARVELAFFLRAWERRYAAVRAELV